MRDKAGIVRWLHLSSRRYVAMAKRARKAKAVDLARAHHAETWAECLYAAASALAAGKEIAPPGDWDLGRESAPARVPVALAPPAPKPGRRNCAHGDYFCDVCRWADGLPLEELLALLRARSPFA